MNNSEVNFTKNQSFQHREDVLCSEGNIAQLACLSKNCEKYAFICNNADCQCFKMHSRCLHVSTKTISKIIFEKEISIEPLQKVINQKIDTIIDRVSDFRQKTLQQLKSKFILFGLSQNQKIFANALEKGQVHGLTGKKMWEIHLNLQKQKEILKSLNEADRIINKLFEQFDSSTQVFFIQLEETIEKLRMESEYFLSNRNCKKFQDSKIIKNHEEEVKIQIFFGKLKIRAVQLLYRASENYFDVERFHVKCDHIPHTLTLCETEFQKIIGGYTPISWQTLQNWVYAKDQTSCSFIFSLSNNDKFPLHQPSRAVIHRNDFTYGPQFGGGSDLIISDKANINSESFSRINTSYCNTSYKLYQAESYRKFSGSETQFFRIKDWEVWRVDFQQQK